MIEEKLVNILIEKGYTISSAESCTGGLFAGTIVNVPNASKVFNSSVVTYSNEAKQKYCNVSIETLKAYGAVSEETAFEMAKGIAIECNSNIGVGITGIAGPGGATPTKPVGMVCFGFNVNGKITTSTMIFSGDRQTVRKSSVEYAMTKLIELLS